MTATPHADALERLIGFGRDLRRRGLNVGTGRIVTFCRGAVALGALDRTDLYWAARSSLISRPEDVDAFDEAFAAWFRDGIRIELDLPASAPSNPDPPDTPTRADPLTSLLAEEDRVVAEEWHAIGDDEEIEGEASIRLVASAVEVLRERSFADLTDEERARVNRMIRRLAVEVPTRSTRRYRPATSGARFDVRRTVRRSLRTHGEPFHRAWRTRGTRSRPVVLVLDISGSMAPYARALVQFGFAAMAAGRRVEVFCFGTRLTRVTRVLRTRDPDRAMHEIGRLVGDWEGGTRIGVSLKALLDGWSQRAALRGAVAVICSDGLERGEPDLLREQMARLRRLVHRVVWVNPLKGSPRYEPLARGMAAALPSIDVFLAGHNLESLEELAAAIGR
ncbi:MAG TPA: VWA domain-containing protein [Actinomycetota bacterium]|nr:VWA domain-containing protein [Actinomycetota bacterium]